MRLLRFFRRKRIRLARHIIIGIWVWSLAGAKLTARATCCPVVVRLSAAPAALYPRYLIKICKYAALGSSVPFPWLPRAPPHVCTRRNVYDHGEIKSTAKILPLIRMWSLLPPSLRRSRSSSEWTPLKPASPLPFPLSVRAVARKTETDDGRWKWVRATRMAGWWHLAGA